METPDPPNDTPAPLKQVVLTPHDIPRILRVLIIPYVTQPTKVLVPLQQWGIQKKHRGITSITVR